MCFTIVAFVVFCDIGADIHFNIHLILVCYIWGQSLRKMDGLRWACNFKGLLRRVFNCHFVTAVYYVFLCFSV